jgi:hypothetical protein
MNEMSLSRLYRRLAEQRPALPEAELGRLLRELQPESEALAAEVARVQHPAHPQRGRGGRVAAGGRRRAAPARWIGALAACLALAIGVFTLHGAGDQRWNNVAGAARSISSPDPIVAANDHIFAASNDGVAPAPGDEIFRGRFSAGG